MYLHFKTLDRHATILKCERKSCKKCMSSYCPNEEIVPAVRDRRTARLSCLIFVNHVFVLERCILLAEQLIQKGTQLEPRFQSHRIKYAIYPETAT